MSIVLSDGVTAVSLPDQLNWMDERSWSPVVQGVDYSLTGAAIVQSAEKKTGRPITLAGSDDRAWMSGAVVEQLAAWASVAGKQLSLTLRGVTRAVIYRHDDAPALDARELFGAPDPDDESMFVVTLKLMEI